MATTSPAEVHVHRDPPNVQGSRDRLGVVLLIVADIAFVACLIFTYLYLRFLDIGGMWLPPELDPASPGPTWLIIAVLAVGAGVFAWGVRGLRLGRQGNFASAAVVSLVLVLVALALQVWQLQTFNFAVQENGRYLSAYSSCMVALAGANFFHLILTAFISVGMVVRARKGLYRDPAAWQPRIARLWWAWVLVSALVVGLMTTYLVGTPGPTTLAGG